MGASFLEKGRSSGADEIYSRNQKSAHKLKRMRVCSMHLEVREDRVSDNYPYAGKYMLDLSFRTARPTRF